MPKRILQGVVVSDKQDKTVVVSVERQVMHPVYKSSLREAKSMRLMMKIISSKSGISFGLKSPSPIPRPSVGL